jgi:hypothetical protein
MMPTLEELVDAQNAINAQQPSLTGAPRPGAWHNEQDGNGHRVLRLTAQQVATIATALGIATSVGLEARKPEPAQLGWAAIIDAALMARGAAGLCSESLRALERVDLVTLERMAALVLGDRSELGPDTPETVAEESPSGPRCPMRAQGGAPVTSTVCTMLELSELLDAAKLYVVSIDDKALLDAMAASAIAVYRDGRRRFLHEAQQQAVCEAELNRRGTL